MWDSGCEEGTFCCQTLSANLSDIRSSHRCGSFTDRSFSSPSLAGDKPLPDNKKDKVSDVSQHLMASGCLNDLLYPNNTCWAASSETQAVFLRTDGLRGFIFILLHVYALTFLSHLLTILKIFSCKPDKCLFRGLYTVSNSHLYWTVQSTVQRENLTSVLSNSTKFHYSMKIKIIQNYFSVSEQTSVNS